MLSIESVGDVGDYDRYSSSTEIDVEPDVSWVITSLGTRLHTVISREGITVAIV
jgi:hypothetical protein